MTNSTQPTKPINRAGFFNSVKVAPFKGPLGQRQVDGLNAILDEWEKRKIDDRRWLAYILATAFHESGWSMAAVNEIGKGAGRDYGKKIRHDGKPYTTPNVIYFGRGLVQLTWYENYELMGKLLKIDLLNNPDLALKLDIAVKILFEGMTRGLFTGVSLVTYLNDKREDWTEARKIINGSDQAALIAVYAKRFLQAINA